MTRPPLGHVRDTVLELPEYDLKILLNGYPAHSARCRRASAQRDRIRQPDYDPSDRVRNECLDVACDCGTDRRYTCYLEDQLHALRAQAEAWAVVQAIADADPPIGRQEARMFAQKAIRLAQADAGGEA